MTEDEIQKKYNITLKSIPDLTKAEVMVDVNLTISKPGLS